MMERMSVSFLIVILSCYIVQGMDLLLSSTLEKNSTLAFTPCDNNTDCEDFLNGVCKDHYCECNGTKFCEDKTGNVVMKIGQSCKIDANCHIEHSVCKEEKCVCAEGRVQAVNGRKCLKLAEALGSTCEEDMQCSKKVSNSSCQNEKCVCEQQMHEDEGSCYNNVDLGGVCQQKGDCSATNFTRCLDRCICEDGYVQSQVANECLEVVTKIKGLCYQNIQCSKLGNAHCEQGQCQCVEPYQFKSGKTMKCVLDMRLGESCQNHTECHGLEKGESRSECILGVCKCRSEFREEHGFCTIFEQANIYFYRFGDFKSKMSPEVCNVGKCECLEERPFCTNSVKKTKAKGTPRRKLEDDDLPPREIREVMISGVFWTYNIFLYVYWEWVTDDERRLLRKYTFPCLVLYFHGFSDSNIYHIWISEVLVVLGMIFRAMLL